VNERSYEQLFTQNIVNDRSLVKQVLQKINNSISQIFNNTKSSNPEREKPRSCKVLNLPQYIGGKSADALSLVLALSGFERFSRLNI
jgi:hypothetical protein